MKKPSNSEKTNILITGSRGQVGSALNELLQQNTQFQIHALDSESLDITDLSVLSKIFKEIKPNIVINAAAYTNVDGAETNADLAFLVNTSGPANLAKLCALHECFLIHYSSDYVYDSVSDRPIKETDPCDPKSIYAQSKLDGDHAIIQNTSHYCIIRTSWVYGQGGKNFVNTMLKLSEQHQHLKIVDDQIGAPTYAGDIADITRLIINKVLSEGKDSCTGIYNFSNLGQISWADFATQIFKLAKKSTTVEGISTESYGAPAHRPKWSVLSTEKIENLLTVRTTDWDLRLFEYLRKYS